MTGPETDRSVDRLLAARAARQTRITAIMEAPEARGRENVAFALACRSEIPAGRAIALMAEAPELSGVEAIIAWVDAIPARPPLEIVQCPTTA